MKIRPDSHISGKLDGAAQPNNKEGKPFEHYISKYIQLDPKETAQRCAVSFNEASGGFELTFMGNDYFAAFPDFSIKLLDKKSAADQLSAFGASQILLLRHLIEGRLIPALGKFLTYREMPWGELYNDNFTGRCIRRLAFAYGNKIETFVKVMHRLNAKEIKSGDCAYELEFMPGLFVRFILWSGDDEFPPSSQILFSDNFSSAFTAEDMAVVGDVSINAMREIEKQNN